MPNLPSDMTTTTTPVDDTSTVPFGLELPVDLFNDEIDVRRIVDLRVVEFGYLLVWIVVVEPPILKKRSS